MNFSPHLLELLRDRTTRVAVLTGAGVSKESGVPTFRDKDGLWQKFRPEELANMNAFLANPRLVWEWYEHRRQVLREVRPNAGHHALVEMARRFPSFTLATQNVDGLHGEAGQPAVLELHGNIKRSFCIACGKFASLAHLESLTAAATPAKSATCEACGEGLLRPDVVWFGENLPVDILEAAHNTAEGADLYFTIGTSGAVYPAAGLPLVARAAGAWVVEINPGPTELSGRVDEVLTGPSAVILPQLVATTS